MTTRTKSCRATEKTPTKLRGEVVQVDDGDTFLVHVSSRQGSVAYSEYERIRLRRGNAPELRQRGGPRAKERLEKRLYGRIVEVETFARVQSRLIGEVRVLPTRRVATPRKKKGPPSPRRKR